MHPYPPPDGYSCHNIFFITFAARNSLNSHRIGKREKEIAFIGKG
jgi:hypothetical protein